MKKHAIKPDSTNRPVGGSFRAGDSGKLRSAQRLFGRQMLMFAVLVAAVVFISAPAALSDNFTVAHPVTGSTDFTNTNEVDVVLFHTPDGYDEWQITEYGAPPTGAWNPTSSPPSTCTFTLPYSDTNVVLTAWFTNQTESVALTNLTAEILYTTAAPEPSVHESLTVYISPEGEAVVTGADLDNGSTGGEALSEAMEVFQLRALCLATPTYDTTPEELFVTITNLGVYSLYLEVINEAGTISTSATPVTVTIPAGVIRIAEVMTLTPGDGYLFSEDTVIVDGVGVILTLSAHGNYGTVAEYHFNGLIVTNGAQIVCMGQNVSPWDIHARGTAIVVDGDLVVAADSQINADSRGFSGATSAGSTGRGPGGGASGNGGGYGSRGGRGGGFPYGTATNAVHLGSGGGGGSLGDGGNGGGTVVLIVGGTLTIDGTVSANGGRGGGTNSGCGSGGSVFISAGILSGNGIIRTNGGDSKHVNNSGGGSGGRIGLANVDDFRFGGLLQVNGGLAGDTLSKRRGYSGTIHFPDNFNLVVGPDATPGEVLSPLRLGSDGVFNYTFDSVTVNSNAVLEVEGNPDMNGGSGSGGAASISANSVQVDGSLSANRLGFGGGGTNAGGEGQGAGNGAGYGGRGSVVGGAPYGTARSPVYLGSGGNGGSLGAGGNGGGALILDIAGTLHVSGTISANGGNASGANTSAGSGGSIYLVRAGSLTGDGTLSANGGNIATGRDYYGSGGGGRIDISNVSDMRFKGSIQVNGGNNGVNAKTRGFAGTIVFPDNFSLALCTEPSPGEIRSPLRLGTDGVFDYVFISVHIREGATLEIDGLSSLNGGHGGAATISAHSMEIDGTLSAYRLGFGGGMAGSTGGSGPGGGGTGSGASHAGVGSGASPPTPYGNPTNAVSFGSGGGGGSLGHGGGGGGAIMLDIADTLTIDGTVSANAANAGARNAGGGAGGSVNISTRFLSGSGIIRANGGGDGNGQGGGGRIVVTYGRNSFAGLPEPGLYENLETLSSTVTVSGGYNTGADGPEDGSIYIFRKPLGTLMILR